MGNVVREAVEGIGISELPQTLGSPALFTEVAIPEIVKIPDEKPDIEELLSVMVDAKIVSLRIIDTPKGTSHEGQRLTGKKLSIELLLKQKVKYIADEPTQSVHAAHFEHTVSSIWVIVPEKIGCKPIETLLMQGKLVVTPYIEDIYGEQLDKRTIFKNITVLVHVTTPCSPQGILQLVKTPNKNYVEFEPGNRVTYSIVITNSSSEKATNVFFKDPLPANTAYVTGTFKVNNVAVAGDPTLGINIGDIDAYQSKVVTFDITVAQLPPPPYIIENVSTLSYKYDNLTDAITSCSNPATVTVQYPLLSILKIAPSTIKTGSTLTYNFAITNTGTLSANNITFRDNIPAGTTFVNDSFRVNGVYKLGADPTSASGVPIGTLNPGESLTVTFDTTVTAAAGATLTNMGTGATFTYYVDPNGPASTATFGSNFPITTVTP